MRVQREAIFVIPCTTTPGCDKKKLYVVVVSPDAFNALFMPIVLPIKSPDETTPNRGFKVSMAESGCVTKGRIICNLPRAVNLNARNGRYVETLPKVVMAEVLARVRTIFEWK